MHNAYQFFKWVARKRLTGQLECHASIKSIFMNMYIDFDYWGCSNTLN